MTVQQTIPRAPDRAHRRDPALKKRFDGDVILLIFGR